jgi:deazaflavin-dependent oxidoreductase (nitroreductase family)
MLVKHQFALGDKRMSEVSERNKSIVDEFRANEGRVGGYFEGKTLLLLHTKGARSRQERINPVAYVRDGDRFVVIASKGGAPTNPDWYYNLVANPAVTIEVGTETFHVGAAVTVEPERTRLYNKMVEMMPGFDDYRKKTTRKIPVFVLTPVK